MKLPRILKHRESVTVKTDGFGGIDRTPGAAHSDLENCLNMSPARLPALCPRRERSAVTGYEGVTDAFFCGGAIFSVEGTALKRAGVTIATVAPGEKQWADAGEGPVIFPDKLIYSGGALRPMEVSETRLVNVEITGEDAEIRAVNPGAGFTSFFAAGDGIRLSGFLSRFSNNKTVTILSVSSDKITVAADALLPCPVSEVVTFRREVPDMDFITAHCNRLWGVKNGRVYGSKEGSFVNFGVFDGKPSDSYREDFGASPAFCGIAALGNAVVAMSRSRFIEINAKKPGSYDPQTFSLNGLRPGTSRSAVNAGGKLYYLASDGIYAYKSGQSVKISGKLGEGSLRRASIGADGGSLYVSAYGDDGPGLFTYDLVSGVWLREDAVSAARWLRINERLCFLDGESGKIVSVTGNSGGVPDWEFTLSPKRGVTLRKVTAEADVPCGAWFELLISRDGGAFVKEGTFANMTVGAEGFIREEFRVIPQFAGILRIKIAGRGDVTVRNIITEVLK